MNHKRGKIEVTSTQKATDAKTTEHGEGDMEMAERDESEHKGQGRDVASLDEESDLNNRAVASSEVMTPQSMKKSGPKPTAGAEKPAKPDAGAEKQKPKAVAEKPKAGAAKPKASTEKPKAVAAKPKAVAVTPKAAAAKPKAAAAKPKAGAAKPKAVADKAKPIKNKKADS